MTSKLASLELPPTVLIWFPGWSKAILSLLVVEQHYHFFSVQPLVA